MKNRMLVQALFLIATCHAFGLPVRTNDAVKGAGGDKSGIIMASGNFITNYDIRADESNVTFKLQCADANPCLWIKAYEKRKNCKAEMAGYGIKIEVNNVVLEKDRSILQGLTYALPFHDSVYMVTYDKYNEENKTWVFKIDSGFINNNDGVPIHYFHPVLNHWYAFDLAGIARQGENKIRITLPVDWMKINTSASVFKMWDGFHIGELALINRDAVQRKIQEYEASQNPDDYAGRLEAEKKRRADAARFPEGKAPVIRIEDGCIVKDGKPFLQLHVQGAGSGTNSYRNILFYNWFNNIELTQYGPDEAANFEGYLAPDWEKQDIGAYLLLGAAKAAYNADVLGDVRYVFNASLDWAPQKYLKRFPEFYALDSCGNRVKAPYTNGGYYPNLGNDKYLEYINQIATLLGRKAAGHPGIFAHSAWEELRWRGDGKDMEKLPPQDTADKGKYRGFLEEKYKNIAALNKEWGLDYKNFAGIEPPKTKEASANFLNFQLFRAALLSNYARNIYEAVKKACPDAVVTGERSGAWIYGAWGAADDEFGPSKYCDIRTVLMHGLPWGRAVQRYLAKQGHQIAVQSCNFFNCEYKYANTSNLAWWRMPKTKDERGLEILRGGFMNNSFYNQRLSCIFEGAKSAFCYSYDEEAGHLLHNQKRYSQGLTEVGMGGIDTETLKGKLPDVLMEHAAKDVSDVNGLSYKLSPLLLPAGPERGKAAFLFSGRTALAGLGLTRGYTPESQEWWNLQKLFEHLHVPNEVIIPETFNDEINDYQLVVAGNWATMGTPEMAEKIKSFVEQGKTVVFYPEAFSCDWNTTRDLPASPGYGLDKLFCARVKYRLSDKSRKVQVVEDISPSLKKGDTFNVRSLITPLECFEGGKVLAVLEETGDPVIVSANGGRTYYLGFMPGVSYALQGTGADDGKIRSLFAWIAAGGGVEKPVDIKGGDHHHFVYARSMIGKDYWLAAFLNDYWEKQEIEALLNFLPVNTKYDLTDVTDPGKPVVLAKGKSGEDLKKEGIRLSLDALRGRALVIRRSDQEVLVDCPEYELKALTENNPVDIVLPANCSGNVAEAAQKLLTCLKSKNISARVVKDDEIPIKELNTSLTEEGCPLGEFHNKVMDTEKNLILIGNSGNNRLIANLCQPGNYTYDKVLDDVDEIWPGKSRGIIQVSESVNKPYFCPTDKSRDAILAGGSDDVGTVKAMERLVSILDKK